MYNVRHDFVSFKFTLQYMKLIKIKEINFFFFHIDEKTNEIIEHYTLLIITGVFLATFVPSIIVYFYSPQHFLRARCN